MLIQAMVYTKTMKILHKYIGKSLLVTFIVTLLVMIGILCLGNLLKIADLIVKGLDAGLLFKFFFFLIISLLQYAIPMAILTATLLVFGRLSADNEITGMRAGGIGLATITAPVFFLAALLTFFCLYLHNTAIPNYNFAIRKLKTQIGLQDPEFLLEPGERVKLPGYEIYVKEKKDGVYHQVLIHQYEEERRISAIFAERASITREPGQEGFTLKLYEGTLDEYDKKNPQISTHTTFGELDYPINLKALYEKPGKISKRTKDMTRPELRQARRQLVLLNRTARSKVSKMTTELHMRLSLSLACLSFVIISIPLAIKAHRSEKSIGMALSLVLIFIFYIFIAYAKAVAEYPERYPQFIIWIPNILYGGLGMFWIAKFTRI